MGAPTGPRPDPRPLTDEPMSMDLLNTTWVDAAGPHDLLADLPGLQVWLAAHGLERAPLAEATRTALVRAREALRRHVADRTGAEELNDLLARGALVRALGERGPLTRVVVDDPADLPAWTSVEDYLQLLARDASRVRRCAGHRCVLHFYDTSKRGDRRWCSMAGCGNRAKAARHYSRSRRSTEGSAPGG